MSRYTVVYEGDPNGARILSGEVPTGTALGVGLGDRFAEETRLRTALIATGRNLGAFLSEGVSTDFLMHLPEESRLVVERLKRERAEAEARAIAAESREADLRRERNALVVAMASSVVGAGQAAADPAPVGKGP